MSLPYTAWGYQHGHKTTSLRLTSDINIDMTVAHNKAKNVFSHIYEAARRSGASHYQRHVEQVKRILENDRSIRQSEMQQPLLSDAPIVRAFGPDDVDRSTDRIWYDYNVSIEREPHSPRELLHIRAKTDFVTSVIWVRNPWV